ncbi:MAG: hypothetical protein AAB217_23500 [Chloroflexota bacterium]
MQKFQIFLCGTILSSLIMSGCASAPNYGDAFSASETMKGNAESIPAAADIVWTSALEVVVQQGFNIEQADAKGRIMHVTKEIRNRDDKELSHTVKGTITMVPLSDQMTRVMLSANQTTELHKKSYVWWHLLWMIPIFPTGTEYTTVVTDRDTVRSPEFYQSFFSELTKALAEKQKTASEKVDVIPLPTAQSAMPASALTITPVPQ